MKGLGITPKQMSIIFLVIVIFVSLALSGYSFLVSKHSASFIMVKEGMTADVNSNEVKPNIVKPSEFAADKASVKKDEKTEENMEDKKEEKKEDKALGWLSVMKSSLGMNELKK
jgi:ABC-type antimicrobial peptide transport system permease subunit